MDAELSVRTKDGKTVYHHLAEAARLKHPESIAKLNAVPEFPEALEYLKEIFDRVHARSGFTPSGHTAPLTWETLAHYQTVYQCHLTRNEVETLFELDTAVINADMERESKKAEQAKKAPTEKPDHG